MSDCMCSKNSVPTKQVCPECGSACIKVEMQTLYHQVKFPENQAIAPDSYSFCPSKQCPIGYFSIAGEIVPKQQLRSYQEIQSDKLCYCFDIDKRQYLSAIKAQQGEAVKNFVIQRTQSGECACKIRNPSGQCCLVNFKHLENE